MAQPRALLFRHRLAVFSLAATLSVLSATYAATHLTFTGSRGTLAGKESPQRRFHQAYLREFPDRDPVLVVARGPRPERVEAFAETLAARLAANGGMVPFARRFLIPTDGGPEAAMAVRLGLRLARALGASVRALSVVDPQMVYRIDRLSSPEPLAEIEKGAQAAVAAVAREVRRLGVPCQTAVREGPIPATILDEARKSRAGLLVLGTRGHTGLARFFLGSVAAAVAAKAPCPVLLVPPAARPRPGRKRS